jgi:soluble lytic murein transglycosylase-like protein
MRMLSATLSWLTTLAFALYLSASGNVAAARNAEDPSAMLQTSCQLRANDASSYRDFAICEAERTGLPPQIAVAVIEIESGFNPDAKGAAGEIGLMQVMPSTAKMLGFQGSDDQLAEPSANIKLGVSYLAEAHRLAQGDLCTALMKYRAGHKQTRFSDRSVTYCLKARKILARGGFRVTGDVPLVNLDSKGATVKLAASNRSGKAATSADRCSRRILVPGPLFRTCADVLSVRVTRFTISRRGAH